MSKIKQLKRQIKACNQRIEQQRCYYYQMKGIVKRESRRLIIPLVCSAVFTITFSWAYFESFRRAVVKAGKKISNFGLTNIDLLIPLFLNGNK